MIESQPITVRHLLDTLSKSKSKRTSVNEWETLGEVRALVNELEVWSTRSKAAFDEILIAFKKFHERALADITELLMWEVVKHPSDRHVTFDQCEKALNACIQEITNAGELLWERKVRTPLQDVPVSPGQQSPLARFTHKESKLETYRDVANHWARKNLYDRLRDELDKQGLQMASLQAAAATVRAADYAKAMKRMTWVMIVVTATAAFSTIVSAVPTLTTWLHKTPTSSQLMTLPRPTAREPHAPTTAGNQSRVGLGGIEAGHDQSLKKAN